MLKSVQSRFCLIAAIAAPMVLVQGVEAQTVQSTFDSGIEGWAVITNGGAGSSHAAVGGNPGGYLQTTDATSGAYTNSAPSAFLGNLLAFDRGTFAFDAILVDPDGWPALAQPGRVTIRGGGDSATLDLAPNGYTASWTRYCMPLSAVVWGKTQVEWSNILGSVGAIEIVSDATNGNDTTGLDNVTLAVPELSVETVRLGTPPNPDAFYPGVTTKPAIGQSWNPVIDHSTFAPSAFLDFVGISVQGSANLATGLGTLLILPPFENPIIFNASPGTPFAIAIPNDCSFVGLPVWTQGGSVSPGPVIELANALDLVLGNT